MGYEFTLRFAPSAGLAASAQVFTCLAQVVTTTDKLIEVARSPASYAFAAPLRSQWPEDFVVMVDSQQWYLCFPAATDAQQRGILQALIQCLHATGIMGTFEEL